MWPLGGALERWPCMTMQKWGPDVQSGRLVVVWAVTGWEG